MVCSRGVLVLFMVIIIGMLIVLCVWNSDRKERFQSAGDRKMILTMTTCLHKKGRFENVQKFIQSFQQHHPLSEKGSVFQPYFDKVVFINEVEVDEEDEQNRIVSSPDNDRYTSYFKKVVPEVELIQKTRSYEKGQARSLNILIDRFLRQGNYKYWVHWEDSWVIVRPLFPEVVSIMDQSPDVHQLQLTDDWMAHDQSKNHNSVRASADSVEKNCRIIKNPYTMQEMERGVYDKLKDLDISRWPTYSLRPSINRLSFFQHEMHPFYFLEDPRLWPIWFEWEFARNFCRCGGVKAVAHKPFASRVPNHEHTYHYPDDPSPSNGRRMYHLSP